MSSRSISDADNIIGDDMDEGTPHYNDRDEESGRPFGPNNNSPSASPTSFEVSSSRATPSQRLTMDELIQSQNPEEWDNLARRMRRERKGGRKPKPAASVVAVAAATRSPSTGLAYPSKGVREATLDDAPSAASAATATMARIPPLPSGRVELVEDNTGQDPPVAMTDAAMMDEEQGGLGGVKTTGLELTCDDAGPPTLSSNLEAGSYVKELATGAPVEHIDDSFADFEDDDKVKKVVKAHGNLHELSPPVPFNPAEFDSDDDQKVKKPFAAAKKKPVTARDENYIMHPPSNDDEPEREDRVTSRRNPRVNRFLMRVGRNRRGGTPAMGNITQEPRQVNGDQDNSPRGPVNALVRANSSNTRPRLDEEPEQGSVLVIPHATLVEDRNDEEVIVATPLEPELLWYKQKIPRLALAMLCIVLIVLSIALGVALSRDNTIILSQTLSPSVAPSASAAPSSSASPSASTSPSGLPSSPPSMAPSSFPSTAPSSSSPPSQAKCFEDREELKTAVDQYIDVKDCANDIECQVGRTYGWLMNSWCTSKVTNMNNLFSEKRSFNEDISSWDVSSVENMQYMFRLASSFNGSISSWNVSSVNNMEGMFQNAESFNEDISSWNVSSVNTMLSMFEYAVSFNGDISLWNVSSVTNMGLVFAAASSFNQDISSWDISSVYSMQFMFWYASSFNQDLCAWRDAFPYDLAGEIFFNSGCTFQDEPQLNQEGPFCASICLQ